MEWMSERLSVSWILIANVQVSGESIDTVGILRYDAPVATFARAANAPVTASSVVVTLQGSNLGVGIEGIGMYSGRDGAGR